MFGICVGMAPCPPPKSALIVVDRVKRFLTSSKIRLLFVCMHAGGPKILGNLRLRPLGTDWSVGDPIETRFHAMHRCYHTGRIRSNGGVERGSKKFRETIGPVPAFALC